jgi:ABC-type glycerol-3-phosphate transport system substrate-binding protein
MHGRARRLSRRLALGAALTIGLGLGGAAPAAEFVIWHDLGDNGVNWLKEVAEHYRKVDPSVDITSVSFPTDQWFGKVIAALNTNTAPDLIFNNYERVIRIQTQTGKVMDLKAELPKEAGFLGAQDLQVATYRERMIIFPVQRVQMAFGARKSWLEKVGEPFPATWADVLRVAAKFRDQDPDGNGKADTFGLALQAAKPRDLIHMLDLFTFGSGLSHTLVDPSGRVTLAEPRHRTVLVEFLKAFTDYRLVAPDTVNHSFGEMYQVIEGKRAGMFRVGDWNVRKWDGEAVLGGDFVIGTWPAFAPGDRTAVVIGGMRGVAVPENAPDRARSLAVAKFLLGPEAQKASLKYVGASVRSDFDMSDLGLSERRMQFANPKHPLRAYDFPESIHPWYPEVEAELHKRLLAAIAAPPKDWGAFVDQLAVEMQALVDAKRKA